MDMVLAISIPAMPCRLVQKGRLLPHMAYADLDGAVPESSRLPTNFLGEFLSGENGQPQRSPSSGAVMCFRQENL